MRALCLLAFVCIATFARAADPGDPNMRFPIASEADLDAIAAMLPPKPIGVGRPITDRAAWTEAAKHPYFQKQLTDAAAFAKEPIPEITEEMLTEVARSGRRDTYEVPFRKRTTRLGAFVVAECIQDQGTYLPLIEAELGAILHEATWAHSAAVAWNQLAGGRESAVELGAAARAWSLATVDYWLGDKLKPETRAAIREQMRRRVFNLYEESVRSGKPIWWWMSSKVNWNSVCTAGVLGAALTLIESPQERALYVHAAQTELPLYMEGISDDGYCYEGAGYWGYGYGNYLRAAELLYQQTQGKINFYAGAKQRRAALFLHRLQIIPKVLPAFGDAHPKSGEKPPGALDDLINQRWGMGWTGLDLSQSDLGVPGALGDNLSGFGQFGFPRPDFGPPPGSPATPDEAAGEDKRSFFQEASVLVSRSLAPGRPPFGLAIKGGHNSLPHGHNDNGSYVVAYGDFPLLLDPGMEFYTANSMNSHRYESMMMNSYGHDVPYVGKTLQKTSTEALGKIVSTTFTDEKDTLVMDLTTSYPVPGLRRLLRTYVLDRRAPSVEIDEEVEFDQPTDYGTALVTISGWQEKGPGTFVVYEKNFALEGTVTLESPEPGAHLVNKVEPIKGFKLYASIHPTRLGVNLNQPVTRALLKTRIVPAPVPTP